VSGHMFRMGLMSLLLEDDLVPISTRSLFSLVRDG
jgi:hypothetical protein